MCSCSQYPQILSQVSAQLQTEAFLMSCCALSSPPLSHGMMDSGTEQKYNASLKMSELILFFPQNLKRNITSQINSRQVMLALLEVSVVDEKWKSAAQPQVSAGEGLAPRIRQGAGICISERQRCNLYLQFSVPGGAAAAKRRLGLHSFGNSSKDFCCQW